MKPPQLHINPNFELNPLQKQRKTLNCISNLGLRFIHALSLLYLSKGRVEGTLPKAFYQEVSPSHAMPSTGKFS